MNVLLFNETDLILDGTVSNIAFVHRRATHIREILRAQVGSIIRVGRIGGDIGTAKITAIDEHVVHAQILELETNPPRPSAMELVLALPRPKSLKRVLRSAANLGIKSIHIINSVKVDKSYWSAPALRPDDLREALLEGLMIANDTVMPTVKLHKLFKPFAQDVAPHLTGARAYVLHPSTATLEPSVNTVGGATQVAIGPEGGFSSYEVGLLNEAGFVSAAIGSRIFSVENMIPVAASIFG